VKTCILGKRTPHGWPVIFSPGLPYDPLTKGMPHNVARIRSVKIQNPRTHKGEDFIIIDDGVVFLSTLKPGATRGRTMPNVAKEQSDYIYAMIPAKNGISVEASVKEALKGLGYKIFEDKEALLSQARSKLTKDELAALENNIRIKG